jgi:hypothetical protein
VKLAGLRRLKKTCFPSYAGCRCKTNAVISLYMGHILRRYNCKREIGKGKETCNLDVVDVVNWQKALWEGD